LENEEHLEIVPFLANHHVLYLPRTEIAVVLILWPLNAGSKYLNWPDTAMDKPKDMLIA
jgi:hypothetical protein